MREHTSRVIETYTSTLPSATWQQMSEFVRGTVLTRFATGRAARDTERALHALTGFADWVLFTGIGELDPSVLRTDVIDAYTARRLAEVTPAVAERERKLLRTLGGIENGPESRRLTTSAPPSQPYSPDEQNQIRRWTEWQSTDPRRGQCRAIAALGLGCGLTSSEMLSARVEDVLILGDGMAAIAVAGRTVPVTAEWNDALISRLRGEQGSHLIGPRIQSRGPKALNSFIASFGHPAPSPQRMRATWLLNHINGQTPLNTLIEAAGLTSPDVLRRLLPFAVRLEGDDRTAALRLATGGAR